MRKPYDSPLFADRSSALIAAAACWLAGAVILWDSYERRGIRRPTLLRIGANVPSVF